MTSTHQDVEHGESHAGRNQIYMVVAFLAMIPGVYLRLADVHISNPVDALLFGLAIVGSAFFLSWAAEVAQLDISAGLAIAVLAFIAVLPEYAVDMVFGWKGGNDFEQFGELCKPVTQIRESNCSPALANMTGANRLLIGIGWSLVVFIAYYRSRKRPPVLRAITLERSHAVEVSFLALATVYSLTLPLKQSITPVDAIVLVGIFVAYTVRISRAPAEEPHLVGPALLIGTFKKTNRRIAVVSMFVFAATVILLVAERFAEALVASGEELG